MLKKQISPKIVALVFGVIVICFAVAVYVSAWTEPGVAPPGGNVDPPLNTSITGQIKEGGLLLGNSPAVVNGLIVANGDVEIQGGTTKTTGGLIIETRINNPVGAEDGRMWLRTDL